MKRKSFCKLLIIFLLLMPMFVRAEVINLDNYEQMDLKESLSSENIEYSFTNYEETDKQVTIYLFRGHGCLHCQEFLEFLNSITAEYGEKFKLRSFEIYNDANNSALMDKLGSVTGKEATGVPYIFIGEKVFKGYTSDWDEDILKAIDTEYNKKEKFDYFEEYNKKELKSNSGGDNTLTIIVVVVVDVLSVGVIIYVQDKNKKEIIRHMNRLYKKYASRDKIEDKTEETDNKKIEEKKNNK